jgi:hypothetical protein
LYRKSCAGPDLSRGLHAEGGPKEPAVAPPEDLLTEACGRGAGQPPVTHR